MSRAHVGITLTGAVAVGAMSTLVGMAPNIVEDALGNPINCGPALFHSGDRPSPLCDATFDSWRLMAEAGLSITACLLIAAIVIFVVSVSGERTDPDPAGQAPASRRPSSPRRTATDDGISPLP